MEEVMDNSAMKMVDVTPFLLVEASGDSEADFDSNMVSLRSDHSIAANEDNEDDAESCTDEDLSDRSVLKELNENHMEVNEGNDEEEPEKEVVVMMVHRNWPSHQKLGVLDSASKFVPAAPQRLKSSVSVDTSMESMDEKEKNRLFWEACLAS